MDNFQNFARKIEFFAKFIIKTYEFPADPHIFNLIACFLLKLHQTYTLKGSRCKRNPKHKFVTQIQKETCMYKGDTFPW